MVFYPFGLREPKILSYNSSKTPKRGLGTILPTLFLPRNSSKQVRFVSTIESGFNGVSVAILDKHITYSDR